jgi:hypothetical protein
MRKWESKGFENSPDSHQIILIKEKVIKKVLFYKEKHTKWGAKKLRILLFNDFVQMIYHQSLQYTIFS